MLMLVTAVPLQGSRGQAMGKGCRLDFVAEISIWSAGALVNFFSRMGLLIKVAIDITDMAEADPKPKHKRKHHGGDFCAAIGCSNNRYNSSVSIFGFPEEKKR